MPQPEQPTSAADPITPERLAEIKTMYTAIRDGHAPQQIGGRDEGYGPEETLIACSSCGNDGYVVEHPCGPHRTATTALAVVAHAERQAEQLAQLAAAAQDLAGRDLHIRCVLAADHGRCPLPAVAVRWEDGFSDDVCEIHARSAEARGALVIRPRSEQS